MAETGVLPPDAHVELLNGEIIDMSTHRPVPRRHHQVSEPSLLRPPAKAGWLVAVQDPVWLDDHSEPQPDLIVAQAGS